MYNTFGKLVVSENLSWNSILDVELIWFRSEFGYLLVLLADSL